MFDNQLIELALREDAALGDVTSEAIFPPSAEASGKIIAKDSLVLAGMDLCIGVFRRCDPEGAFQCLARDGDQVPAGTEVFRFQGKTIACLIAERTALNFLQYLSGIATQTSQYVAVAAPFRVRIVDTRKTVAGFRALAKYAVRCGGGHNHRSGLGDHVLIKENHIAAAGGLAIAIERCRARAPHLSKIEVEVVDYTMAMKAVDLGADVLLLDNMTPAQVSEVVRSLKGRVLLEASGGIHLGNLVEYCRAGPDVISIGALTHSVRAADLSLLFDA